MRNRLIPLAALLPLLFLVSCSTQQNTWVSRHYQELNTRYNVHFNGKQAYLQGIKQIETGFKEDFSRPLPLYEVSDHTKAKASSGNMDRAIEKCQKAIKTHSIRVKPKKKPSSRSSEAAKRFYAQEEFNPFMDDVFLLMAEAQFTKTDFLGASSTCNYIIRHFANDKRLCDKAGILMARAYTEMEWYYEAENLLNDLNKSNLTPSLTSDFSAAYADLLLRRKQYGEAIPYLEIAIKNVKDRRQKQRWTFLLGQLYQETNRRDQAYRVFTSVPSLNPPYEMELSARIRQSEVFPDANPAKPLKKLVKLSKSDKNADYLDQIYYAMGNLYLASKDTVNALKYLHQAVNKSTSGTAHKVKALLTLGDFYYRNERFVDAFPCYSEGARLLSKEDERYKKATERAEILKVVAPPLRDVFVEDSLQAVARMPEKERNELIAALVKEAEKKAKEEARLKSAEEAQAANESERQMNDQTGDQDQSQPIPDLGSDKSWYFYNPSAVAKGLKDFQKKWGKRSLKDDWRRNNKTELFENMQTSGQKQESVPDSLSAGNAKPDSVQAEVTAPDLTDGADNPTNANYYLKNLPFTEDQVKTSNEKIAEGLYTAGLAFREQMQNDRLALKTFRELEQRFPKDKNLENAYYIMYLLYKQQHEHALADSARVHQISLFPESPLAVRLKDSLYVEKMQEMYLVQDTLYERAFQYFIQHETDSIFSKGNYVADNYPMSPLRPRFAFLQAMESARTGQPDEFHRLLTYIVDNYPESDLVPFVQSMLAFWDKGRRPVPSAGFVNRISKDDLQLSDSLIRMDSLSKEFKFYPNEPHFLMFVYQPDSVRVNRLQFDVALYNFTNFLIRDFELTQVKIDKMDVLLVSGFENAEDVVRYRSWIQFQNEKPENKYRNLKLVIVSQTNISLLENGVPLEKYLEFFEQNYSDIHINP